LSKPTGFESIDPNNPASILKALPEIATGKYGVTLGALAALGLYTLYTQSDRHRHKPLKGSAYWAGKEHLSNAKRLMLEDLAANEVGRLSYQLGNLPLYDAITSLLTFGAPKSGKSYGVLNQAIYAHLKQGKPQVIVDLQYPTQTSIFVPMAQHLGYAPKDINLFVPGEKTSGIWNMVKHASGSRAGEMTQLLQANTRVEGAREDGFFGPAGRYLISGTMSTCRNIPGLDDVLGCQAFLSFDDLPARLLEQREKLMRRDPWSYNLFTQFLANARSEKTASSIVGSALNLFTQFCSKDIAPSVTGKTSFPLYMEGKQLLIIGCTPTLRKTVSPLIMALLSLVVSTNAVRDRKDELQVAIDEFPAVKYPALIEQTNEIRKFYVSFNLAAQSINQIRKSFSHEETENLLTAAGSKFWFNPRSNDSAEYLQKSLGTKRYRTTEYSSGQSSGKPSSNRSSQIREKPLFYAHEIQKLKQGATIIQTRGLSSKTEEYIPLKMQLKPSKEYMRLVKKAQASWPFTEKQLSRYSPQVHVDGYILLRGYLDSAEALLPEPQDPDKDEAVRKVEAANRANF
jgi:type IV secretion system protein VirD4